MDINIIAVGKIKEKYITDGINEYVKRIGAYSDIKIIELKEDGNDTNRESSMKKEEEKILEAAFKEKAFNILLDLEGKVFKSEEFAEKIKNILINGNSRINFIIGGSYGVTEHVKQSVDLRLKFSDFTFPHQLMRLILSEQLYRWLNILNNGKYHK